MHSILQRTMQRRERPSVETAPQYQILIMYIILILRLLSGSRGGAYIEPQGSLSTFGRSQYPPAYVQSVVIGMDYKCNHKYILAHFLRLSLKYLLIPHSCTISGCINCSSENRL